MHNKGKVNSHKRKKNAKVCASIGTFIYVLLFPLLTYFTLFSAMVFDSPRMSNAKGILTIFTIALVPLSLPLSIELMWSSYVCKEYGKSLVFISVPWITTVFVLALNFLIRIFLV